MRVRNQEFQLNRGLLEQLASTGSPVDLSVADDLERQGLEIQQTGGIYDSKLFELESGRLGFIASLALTNLNARSIQVVDLQLRSTHIDDWFDWLQPRELRSSRYSKKCYPAYLFPGRHELPLPFAEVLNHILLDGGLLRAKRRHDGWLLGVGGLMPAGLAHGQCLGLTIAIIGSDHSEYTQTLHLFVERNRKPRKLQKRRSDLFERAPVPGNELPNGRPEEDRLTDKNRDSHVSGPGTREDE